ncbi:unnamed protein product [Mytilus edulis]|uniref:Collagen-like protein n=1 Tax=Mytilus edulis TaxID=6550 RepID=A0A8S3VDT1_MYTED|nr:unnamed protein product [Mytilus edulis]
MGDQVELVNILQTEHFQSSEHFQDNVLNIKLAEIHKASRKRDKLIAAFIIVQLFCVLLAVAVNFVYLNDKIENSVRLEKQIQILTSNTSKLTSLDKQLSYDSDMKDLIKGDKDSRGNEGNPGVGSNQGNTGKKEVKGERGETGLRGPIGASGIKGEKGNNGLIGANGQIGDKGTIDEVGPIGEKGVSGEKGPNGDNGIIGEKGSTGIRGPMGDKGEKGTIGDKGQNGAKV